MTLDKFLKTVKPNGLTNLMVNGMLFKWNNGWQYVGLFYKQQTWQLDI